jgi:linoleoyl-CoA desaturase
MSNQNQQTFKSTNIRYKSADTEGKIYRQIRERSEAYFKDNNLSKFADKAFWAKITLTTIIAATAYFFILTATEYIILAPSFLIFGMAMILISMNLGHDAAHSAITGNKRIDDILFRIVFSTQGLSGYLWQIRHNHSHHVLPNVLENDSDMELGGLIMFDPNEGMKWYHKYQHVYAPFLYQFGTLVLLVYQDYEMLERREHGNLRFNKIPLSEWIHFFRAKIVHLTLYLGLPFAFSNLSFGYILLAYISMHFTVSSFMMFTFLISHHVMEVDYVETEKTDNQQLVGDAWIRHQIVTTIDFNENSRFANFLFGGFNLHIAHHIFPEINHTHYPALTKIVKEVLVENNLDWYKSFSFFQGCSSHLKHLKRVTRTAPELIFENLEGEDEQEMIWI